MGLMSRHMQRYVGLFCALLVVCALAMIRSRSVEQVKTTAAFRKHQQKFLVVYLLAFLGDWMQGPYVYALYEHYGYSVTEIGRLFVAGFGASLFFGTFVGASADRMGRKANCMLYGVLYALSCVTKHYNNYNILMLGRVLGGIATSILFSAFETWMVHEHKNAAYPDEWLGHTFQLMTFGNSLVAIGGGVIASVLAGWASEDYAFVAPFDGSLVVLIITTVAIFATWTENYGDRSEGSNICKGVNQATSVLFGNGRVLLLGVIQSCFEAAMYIFVFLWTPALSASTKHRLPHGLIFASFMVCCMVGSFIFKQLVAAKMSVEHFSGYLFFVASLSMAVPVMTESHWMRLFAFFVFEVCVGVYFPSIGTMRGKMIPGEVRATIMNFFRMGLNVIVVIVLENIAAFETETVFLICFMLLSVATVAQGRLHRMVNTNASAGTREKEGVELGDVEEQLMSKTDPSA